MKRNDDPLLERLTKDLVLVPMQQNDDNDDRAVGFQEALADVRRCAAQCDEHEKLGPLFDALEDTFVSIAQDDKVENTAKQAMMRDAVEQFLEEVRNVYPQAPAQLQESMDKMDKLRSLRKVVGRLQAAVACCEASKVQPHLAKIWTQAARLAALLARQEAAGFHSRMKLRPGAYLAARGIQAAAAGATGYGLYRAGQRSKKD
jgi:hypothetical protein